MLGGRPRKDDTTPRLDLSGPRGRTFLKALKKKYNPNVAAIFRRDDVPDGFNIKIFNVSLTQSSTARSMRVDHHRWIAQRIRHYEREKGRYDECVKGTGKDDRGSVDGHILMRLESVIALT